MPLPTFETLDAIPEPFRDMYEVVDGKPVPKDDTAPLKTALEKERKAAQDAAARAKALEQRAAELETQNKAKQAGITDEQLAAIKADALKEIDPIKAERDALASELRAMKLDTKVKSVMAAQGVRADRLDVMWKVIADRFDLNADGTPILRASPTTDLSKAMLDLKAELPEFFAPPSASGGGAQPSAGTVPTGGTPDAHDLFTAGLRSMRRAS
jgi:hypothetical protein